MAGGYGLFKVLNGPYIVKTGKQWSGEILKRLVSVRVEMWTKAERLVMHQNSFLNVRDILTVQRVNEVRYQDCSENCGSRGGDVDEG